MNDKAIYATVLLLLGATIPLVIFEPLWGLGLLAAILLVCVVLNMLRGCPFEGDEHDPYN